jgi:hypothetical protein
VMTMTLLFAAVYVILDPLSASAASQKWAPETISLLVGYWLRGR